MKSQEAYWDKKITEWTKVSYENKFVKFDLIEWLANFFRGPIVGRMEVALELLGPRIKNKVVLDLGCGLGDLEWAMLKYQPKRIIGIDISGVAVRTAKRIAQKRKVDGIVDFRQADVGQIEKLPDFDIAVGLGFIDYLTKPELRKLFELLSEKSFLFSFFEKKISLRNLLHKIYLKLRSCPGAYKYSRLEVEKLASKKLGLRFVEKEKMLFITNLRNT